MTAPTATNLRAWSRINFDGLGYAAATPDPLDRIVAAAIAYVEAVAGRLLDATMPAELESIAEEAVRLRVEQWIYYSQPARVESATDDDVQSFSAGSYSETRRQRNTARGSVRELNPWPALADLLWLLMTDEKKDAWKEETQGIFAPAWGITEEDWSGMGARPVHGADQGDGFGYGWNS